ncbi:HAMP domain-containing protein [Candidatus Sumerlaeota bacterium]|nr:HAMP domain-containing protein [Candidatus Sumerlaeota bacterium]
MKKIYNRILFYFLLVLFINGVVSTFLIISDTRKDFDANLREQLYNYAGIASELVKAKGLDPAKQEELDGVMEQLGEHLRIRISVILPDGKVYADSFYDPEIMENHLYRIEVQNALQGKVGMDARISPTLQIPMTYLAMPLIHNQEIQAVIRVSLPQATIRSKIHHTIFKSIITGALLGVTIALFISFLLARSFSHPIRLIRDAAARISDGDFHYHLQLDRKDELHQVAESLNEMSQKLGNSFESIKLEKEKIAAILSGMKESLVMVSQNHEILLANSAFCNLLQLDEKKLIGRLYWEVLLERDLSEFIKNNLQNQSSAFGELILRKNENSTRFLSMNASPIFSESHIFKGLVIVFHDITPIKETEKMRRQFVDNASHELKTPISSLLAISETLIDREPKDQETRKQFYGKLLSNSERLSQLIGDLLSLSEIEQNKNSLEKAPVDLLALLKDIADEFLPAMKSKNQCFDLESPQDFSPVSLDKNSFRKALGNLLDNAIRYTSEQGKITLSLKKSEQEILIEIKDTGIGIPPEDIPRIFERFYRVDKARSIKLGGTGLGLSISRHIIEAHGGHISVSSSPGKGSVFTIHIPL